MSVFQLSEFAFRLFVQCKDQFEQPYSNLKLELWRDLILYNQKRSNLNGSARFLVANGTYELRVFRESELVHTKSVTVMIRDTFVMVDVLRPEESRLSEPRPFSLNIAEIIIGFGLGYFYYRFSVRRRKSKEALQEEDELESAFQYSTMGID